MLFCFVSISDTPLYPTFAFAFGVVLVGLGVLQYSYITKNCKSKAQMHLGISLLYSYPFIVIVPSSPLYNTMTSWDSMMLSCVFCLLVFFRVPITFAMSLYTSLSSRFYNFARLFGLKLHTMAAIMVVIALYSCSTTCGPPWWSWTFTFGDRRGPS